jgi:TolB-like protein
MKNLFAFITAVLVCIVVPAQKAPVKTTPATKEVKFDIVLKTDGDELEGTVKEILENEIKFNYKGEELIYSIQKSEILKINYASGRIEFFNKLPDPTQNKSGNKNDNPPKNEYNKLGDHHNKVAILPFHYTIDKQRVSEEVSDEVQEECFTFLSKHSEGLTILSPHTTNALLSKAGVNFNTMVNYTMDEICNILGVEYLVEGRVTQIRTGSVSSVGTNYNSGYSSRRNNYNNSTYSSSTSRETFRTTMSVNIFTDKNSSIYNEEKQSIWDSETYKSTLVYLLKRCPLFKK